MAPRLFKRTRGAQTAAPPIRRAMARPGVAAVKLELARKGPPITEREAEEAVERWLSPEPIARSIVSRALWEMEEHWWLNEPYDQCRCGWPLPHEGELGASMRRHKEDVLARMLGLSIKIDAE